MQDRWTKEKALDFFGMWKVENKEEGIQFYFVEEREADYFLEAMNKVVMMERRDEHKP